MPTDRPCTLAPRRRWPPTRTAPAPRPSATRTRSPPRSRCDQLTRPEGLSKPEWAAPNGAAYPSGLVIDPEARAYLDSIASLGLPPLAEQGAVGARRLNSLRAPSLAGELEDVALIEDGRLPGRGGQIPFRRYSPAPDRTLPALLYLHGGGWVVGDLDTHDSVCRALAPSRVHCARARLRARSGEPVSRRGRGCVDGSELASRSRNRRRRGPGSDRSCRRQLGREPVRGYRPAIARTRRPEAGRSGVDLSGH